MRSIDQPVSWTRRSIWKSCSRNLIVSAAGLMLTVCVNVARSAPNPAESSAGRAAEVAAATRSFYAALNRADPEAADRFLLPGGDSFPRSGKALDPEADTAEQSLRNLRASFDAGLRFNVTIRDLQVKVYESSAIATFYTEGTTIAANKNVTSGTFRATYVWVRRPEGWKIAHFHLSPLREGPATPPLPSNKPGSPRSPT